MEEASAHEWLAGAQLHRMRAALNREPYRVFFPLGIAIGVAGVAIWPLYYFSITSSYSGRAHAFIQIEGFVYSFVA